MSELSSISSTSPKKKKGQKKNRVKLKTAVTNKRELRELFNAEVSQTTKTVSPSLQNSNSLIFQAVGVIQGEIALDKGENLIITLDGQQYRLGFTAISRPRKYKALVEEIKIQGNSQKKVLVYPRLSHTKTAYGYGVDFNLVTIAKTEETREGIFQDLAAGEFYLSGFWQYVDFYDGPVVAVWRNYSQGLAQAVERVGIKKAKQLLKTNYIPVDWTDAPQEPFKYDPNVEKRQQMPRYFVRLKARYQPQKNHFEAIEQLGESTTKAPKYLK
ncbi:hypothetical protein NIES4102_42270 (plasmid) [Chondrocystis sp. NIES-4102]|nr:hypothetical protein NIES4102_42270 [Chondrocystis sp. NIES-4102]